MPFFRANIFSIIYSIVYLAILVLLLSASSSAVYAQRNITTINGQSIKPAGTVMYSGYINTREAPADANLWYIFVQSAKTPSKPEQDPLILWFNGGPGCASMTGLFIEHGPMVFKSMAEGFVANPGSWNKIGNVLYIDQPVGVGYSYTAGGESYMPTNSLQAAQDVWIALRKWFQLPLFAKYRQSRLYLTGESYAGRYLPYMYDYFMQQNAKPNQDFILNFDAVMLGNAMIKPSVQYTVYANQAYATGMLSYRSKIAMSAQYERCLADVAAQKWDQAHTTSCGPMFTTIIAASGRVSAMDVRELQMTQSQRGADLETLLSTKQIMDELGVDSTKSTYSRCYKVIFKRFREEFHVDVPDDVILKMISTTRVLFYSGQFDLRVGAAGTSELLRRLSWPGREAFNNMKITPIRMQANMPPIGHFKQFGNVSQAVIYGGSHLVPATQPESALEMARRFIENTRGYMCDDNTSSCLKSAMQCPNDCSDQGICDVNTGTCKCRGNYTGIDCSLAEFPHRNNMNVTLLSKLVGREAAVYRFKMPAETNNLNLALKLSRLTLVGSTFLLVNVSTARTTPSAEKIKHIVRTKMENNLLGGTSLDTGFQYSNLSHANDVYLNLQGVPLTPFEENVVTVAVFNNADLPSQFSLSMMTNPSSGMFNWVYLLLVICLIMVVVILLEASCIYSRWTRRSEMEVQISSRYQKLLQTNDMSDDEEDPDPYFDGDRELLPQDIQGQLQRREVQPTADDSYNKL